MRIVRCLTTLTLSATLTAGVSATVTVPALLSPTPARAETEQAQALNKRTLDAFVASIPAVRAWTEQHEKAARTAAPKVLNPSALLGNPFGLLVKELEGTDAYAAMDIAVSRHGFDTPEAWADVANRVTKALGVLAAAPTRQTTH